MTIYIMIRRKFNNSTKNVINETKNKLNSIKDITQNNQRKKDSNNAEFEKRRVALAKLRVGEQIECCNKCDDKNHIIANTLIYTTDILDKNNIPYWIDFGTLLGAVRDNKVIAWDDDSDICVDEKHRGAILRAFRREKGDKFVLYPKAANKYQVIANGWNTKRKTKFQTDIFFWKKKNNEYHSDYSMIVNNGATPIPSEFVTENNLERIQMCGKLMLCPSCPRSFIEKKWRYGPNSIKNKIQGKKAGVICSSNVIHR